MIKFSMRVSYRKVLITVLLGIALLSYTSVYKTRRKNSAKQRKLLRTSLTSISSRRPNSTIFSVDYRIQKTENTTLPGLQKPVQKLTVTENLPWSIRRTNYLPNFYTQAKKNDTKQYHDSIIVYLHHNKAAGTTTKKCLVSTAASRKRKVGTLLSSQGRTLMERSRHSQPQRLRSHIFMGGYAFGICNHLTHKPCSYFTILRDPYERLISSYSYCKRARRDQICSALGANDVSIIEWAQHQGSFFFQQLLFDPVFCTTHFLRNPGLSSLVDIPHDIIGSDKLNSAPCWFRQKVVMHHVLNDSQSDALLNFCLDNLEKWFAVIGLVEEYEASLALLQGVYNLAFTKCATGTVRNKSNYINLEHMRNMANESRTVNETIKRLKMQLQEDPVARKALEADLRLYQKAKEIFQRQKMVYLDRFQT